MQFKRDGFVYHIAYPYKANQPDRTGLCLLFWRFIAVGLGRLALSVIVWVLFTLMLGLLAFIFVGIPKLLFGQKLVFRNIGPLGDIVGGRYLAHLCVPAYNFEPIESLPTVGGARILPIVPIGVVGLTTLVWYSGPTVARLVVSSLYTLALAIREETIMIANDVGKTGVFVVGFAVGAIACWKLTGLFLKSEPGKLLLAYLKAKKEKVCPIVEFV